MNSTRLVSLTVLIVSAIGLALLVQGESITLVGIGAVLISAAAISLTRHLWRESDRRGKREVASVIRAIREEASATQEGSARQSLVLEDQIRDVSARVDGFSLGILEYMAQMEIDLQKQGSTIDDHQARLGDLGSRLVDKHLLQKHFDVLDRQAQRYRNEVLTQLSGVIGVYETLTPSRPYPPFGGWAIGGDCAQRLVTLIFTERPKWILEAGSGLSTILAAQALEHLGGEGQVISLEHNAEWLENSIRMVAEHGVSHRSRILHTPLVEIEINGEAFQWYDLSQVDLPDDVGILFIDGPPNATGPWARYPAVPLLYDRLSSDAVVLMDDAFRPEERAAIERWQEEFPDLQIQTHADSKGTVEITKAKTC